MLKLAIAAIFLGITLPCFSQENIRSSIEIELNDTNPAYLHVGLGNANLLFHKYVDALENFEDAIKVLANSKDSSPEINLLIRFGQAIAYDNLGLRDQCEQALGSIFLTFYACEGQGENRASIETEDSSGQEYKFIWEFMKQLASLSPSSDVRQLLLDVVDEMADL